MSFKFLTLFVCAFPLIAAQNIDYLDQQLTYETLIYPDQENFCGWTMHNLEAIGAYTQGINLTDPTLISHLKPFKAFEKGIAVQSLSLDAFNQLSGLPLFPKGIKKEDHIILNIFAYTAEAFGKDEAPLYFYATRTLEEAETLTEFDTLTDFQEALMQYRSACSLIHHFPNFSTMDPSTKFQCTKKLADIGVTKAQYRCGDMLWNGEEVEINKQEGFRYTKLAADQGNLLAQYYCGDMFYCGDGVEINIQEAFRYYKLAADQGDIDGQRQCGVMLGNGDGVEFNEQESFRYIKLAADQGDRKAQYYCSDRFYCGIGVEINAQEGFRYIKLAADQGDILAQNECGDMLYKGTGVDVNKQEAFRYYKLAADQGHQVAIEALRIFNLKNKGR